MYTNSYFSDVQPGVVRGGGGGGGGGGGRGLICCFMSTTLTLLIKSLQIFSVVANITDSMMLLSLRRNRSTSRYLYKFSASKNQN